MPHVTLRLWGAGQGGGHEFDSTEIAPLDEDAVREFAESCRGQVQAIAVAGPFAPANRDHEERAAAIIADVLGEGFPVSLSHELGALGLIERENAAILNAASTRPSRTTVWRWSRT